MTNDTSSYRLKAAASCHAGGPPVLIDDTSSAMQRPLLLEDGVAGYTLTPSLKQQQDHNEKDDLFPAKGFHIRCVLIGVVVGLVIQAITLGSFVILLQRWGRKPQRTIHSEFFVYTWILVSSQLVYFGIWVGFVFSLTRSGALYFGKKFDLDNTVAIHHTKQFVFVRSVSFFMGVVLGSFSGWLVVDLVVDLPGNAMPLFTTLVLSFVVYYVLLRSHDWANLMESSYEEEESEEWQQENCRIEMPGVTVLCDEIVF
jgi:hypothetical protein